jgi:hypothetical protein
MVALCRHAKTGLRCGHVFPNSTLSFDKMHMQRFVGIHNDQNTSHDVVYSPEMQSKVCTCNSSSLSVHFLHFRSHRLRLRIVREVFQHLEHFGSRFLGQGVHVGGCEAFCWNWREYCRISLVRLCTAFSYT